MQWFIRKYRKEYWIFGNNRSLADTVSGEFNGKLTKPRISQQSTFSSNFYFELEFEDPKIITAWGVHLIWISSGYSRRYSRSFTVIKFAIKVCAELEFKVFYLFSILPTRCSIFMYSRYSIISVEANNWSYSVIT